MPATGAPWVPRTADPDAVYDAISTRVASQGIDLYPHQDEAIIELLAGSNVVLATPTGSGKSLVAMAAHAAALARNEVSFYTAPIKALVSEKFFELCETFGADNVGMLTGDASVNSDAPIICCTAEVLANIALREGAGADASMVIMDEFHFYTEPDRGWAWQVPLLELTNTQFLLMSATLGDMSDIAADLSRRNGRETAIVDDAERPVPLAFTWSMTPLDETVIELVDTHQAPVYVVHFTQAAAVEHATALARIKPGIQLSREAKDRINEHLRGFRFAAGFGKTFQKLIRQGIGVHHAGILPRYRRLVEQLAQAGLLMVICGTDTLGVGINVPIRTVLFTGLAKFDGRRQRVLRSREFLQIAGRAGRAGFDTSGNVVVQAPEHAIENARALAKFADNPKKQRSVRRKRPPEGSVVWTEETFQRLVERPPEQLVSRMRVNNAMLLNVISRQEDAFPVMRRLLMDNHESPPAQRRLAQRALQLARSLVHAGVITRLDEPDEYGRRYILTMDLPEDFALNQPLAGFALATLEVLDPESEEYTLDIVSVIEAVLEAPHRILLQQEYIARGEAMAEMKADGLEYDERMALLDEVSWPMPLRELLETTFEIYHQTHPWLNPHNLVPKSIVREMYENGMSFNDFVAHYRLARSEGLLLRYLTDAYRTLRQTVPEQYRTPELAELLEWLGETIRQTDSSLLEEWEALADPEAAAARALRRTQAEAAPPAIPRPLSQQTRAFKVMIRNAMFHRVQLIARDDLDALAAVEQTNAERAEPAAEVVMTRAAWDAAIELYYTEHDEVLLDADARGPDLLRIEEGEKTWSVRQTLHDPAGHHDWMIEANVDIPASDEAGDLVLLTQAFRRLGG